MKKRTKTTANHHPRQDAYMKAYTNLKTIERENLAFVTENLCMVALPDLCLYLADGDTRVWVENDPVFGLTIYSADYLKGHAPDSTKKYADLCEFSASSIADMRDSIEEHWDSAESIRLRKTLTSIENLMEGSIAGEHPAVKAISAIAAGS